MPPSRRQMLQTSAASVAAISMTAEGAPAENYWQIQAEKPVPTPSPRVARFEKMAFGMFLHWGLYSQMGRGEWTLNLHKMDKTEYMKMTDKFTARDFNGRTLAKLAKRAGMKYITLTSRHHEGFSLYDTRGLSTFDAMHSAAGRDLIENFTSGCRAEGIIPMLYHTTLDWTEPRFETDFNGYLQYLRDSIETLCRHYGPIGGFWFDGNWSKPKADWQEDKLYGVIRKYQPEALIINNTGISEGGKLGNPEIDSVTFERGRPKPIDRRGHPKYVAGEMCHTMNFHWGIAVKDFNYLSPAHVIEELCHSRRAGANLLMNMGPTASGKIPAYEGAAFERVGDWIRLHGGDRGVIYNGRPTSVQGELDDFALEMDGELYLFIFGLTATSNTQATGVPARGPGKRKFVNVTKAYSRAEWLDNGESLNITQKSEDHSLTLNATGYPYGTNTVVRIARLRSS